MKMKKKNFTLIEILIVVAIMFILIALLGPSYQNARKRAMFTRWFGYNNMLSNNPSCVINFNFQDNGNELITSSFGCESDGYNASSYNGGINGNFEWSDGRWQNSKNALLFNGVDTYVEVLGVKAINFDGTEDFSIITWVNLNDISSINTILSKKAGDENQYLLTITNTLIHASVFGNNINIPHTFETDKWVQIAMCYQTTGAVALLNNTTTILCDGDEDEDEDSDDEDEDSDEEVVEEEIEDEEEVVEEEDPVISSHMTGTVYIYVNGKKISETPINYNILSDTNEKLIIGAEKNNDGVTNVFSGKIEELLIFKHKLSLGNINGHFEMGKER